MATPPGCESCKIFDHRDAECPKNVKVVDSIVEDEDGFTQVKRKNGKGKHDGKAKQVAGIHLTKPKPKLVYREVQKTPTNNNDKATTSNTDSSIRKDNQPTMHPEDGINIVLLRNSFESLMEKDKVLDTDDTPSCENILFECGCYYHLDTGISRCAFKVDIQKAYYTVDWKFLHDVLLGSILVSTLV
ncbi:hypothetical protein Tco_0413392 [Tanacetum coccineum]